MATFAELELLDTRYWKLYLHRNQYYLGCSYLWLARPGHMQRFSSLGIEEMQTFQALCAVYENALESLWHPDHMNYAWLGNDMKEHSGHGHMHLIPRYARPVAFGGAAFVDEQWSKNYAPYPAQTYPDSLLFAIRDALKAVVGRL